MSKILKILRGIGKGAGIALGIAGAVSGIPLPAAMGRYVSLAARIASVTENAVLNAEQAIQGEKRGKERLPLVVAEMSASMQELNEVLADLAGKRLKWPVDLYEKYVAAEVARQNALADFKMAVEIE